MKTNNTTILDLRTSALDAAHQCIDENNQRKDALTVASVQLEAFNAAGHDRGDFETWQGFVNEAIANLIVWGNTPSPATVTAIAAKTISD